MKHINIVNLKKAGKIAIFVEGVEAYRCDYEDYKDALAFLLDVAHHNNLDYEAVEAAEKVMAIAA